MDKPFLNDATQADQVAALIHARQTTLPKRLKAPGPDAAQLRLILGSAAAAPDHGSLLPWRFVIIPVAARERLAQVFAQALRERDASATQEQEAQAREKAHRAPLLLLAVARLGGGDPEIDAAERLVSAGCAIQNMLLVAQAQGFGSALTSGKALRHHSLRTLFGLVPEEQAVCFVNIGTRAQDRPVRQRPEPDAYVSTLPAR